MFTLSNVISQIILEYIIPYECDDPDCKGCPGHPRCIACGQIIFNHFSHVAGCPNYPPCHECGGYMEALDFNHKFFCKYLRIGAGIHRNVNFYNYKPPDNRITKKEKEKIKSAVMHFFSLSYNNARIMKFEFIISL